jgi:hypothetical protein
MADIHERTAGKPRPNGENISSTKTNPARKKSDALVQLSTADRLLLSVAEAAFVLNISKTLVRDYISAGLIPVVRLPHPSKIGFVNRVLIDLQDLKTFAAKWKVNNHAS